MLRLAFWILLIVVMVSLVSFAVGVTIARQESARVAEREYYRGAYSMCYGVVLPTQEECLAIIRDAYAANFWRSPDEGFIFPPPASGTRD